MRKVQIVFRVRVTSFQEVGAANRLEPFCVCDIQNFMGTKKHAAFYIWRSYLPAHHHFVMDFITFDDFFPDWWTLMMSSLLALGQKRVPKRLTSKRNKHEPKTFLFPFGLFFLTQWPYSCL